MKKLRNVMRKCMASLLVLCMAAAPCVNEIGSVFAEPDTGRIQGHSERCTEW